MATRSLEECVTALEETVTTLQALPGEFAAFRRDVEMRFDALERRMTEESEHLYARMRLLHEELIDRIRIGREGLDSGDSDAPRRSRRRPKR